jgi:hypothetical protein
MPKVRTSKLCRTRPNIWIAFVLGFGSLALNDIMNLDSDVSNTVTSRLLLFDIRKAEIGDIYMFKP